jgi:hypothetical protein
MIPPATLTARNNENKGKREAVTFLKFKLIEQENY